MSSEVCSMQQAHKLSVKEFGERFEGNFLYDTYFFFNDKFTSGNDTQ